MPTDSLVGAYEELANRYSRDGEARQRDHCLVLAADAALSEGRTEEAERLRRRLLLTNPHHMLRPFSSMAEAMQSTDVQDYVVDLRRQWLPEVVDQLSRQGKAAEQGATYALSAKPAASKEAASQSAPRTKNASREVEASPGGAGYWVTIVVFTLGIVVAGGLLLAALGGMVLDDALNGR